MAISKMWGQVLWHFTISYYNKSILREAVGRRQALNMEALAREEKNAKLKLLYCGGLLKILCPRKITKIKCAKIISGYNSHNLRATNLKGLTVIAKCHRPVADV